MPELLADVENVSPFGQELRRERVSQIVEPDRPKPCLFQHSLEIPGLHVLDAHEATKAVSEDPFGDLPVPT